jgi:hypothetical protein
LDPIPFDLNASDGDPSVLRPAWELDRVGPGRPALVVGCLANRTVPAVMDIVSDLDVGDGHDVRPITRMDRQFAHRHGTVVVRAPDDVLRGAWARTGVDGELTAEAPTRQGPASPGSGISSVELAAP